MPLLLLQQPASQQPPRAAAQITQPRFDKRGRRDLLLQSPRAVGVSFLAEVAGGSAGHVAASSRMLSHCEKRLPHSDDRATHLFRNINTALGWTRNETSKVGNHLAQCCGHVG